jgi:hypothetical protein
MLALNKEKRPKKPRSVPTGQMLLQYNRPHFHAMTPIMDIVRKAMTKEDVLTMEASMR